MTVLEVLTAAAGFLEKSGVEQSRLNAEHLLGHVLGIKRLQLYLEFDRPLGEKERAPLRELIRKRSEGVPLQHLIGEWDFFGRVFKVDSRALAPRPETEQLVELALAAIPDAAARRVADIGTGSGVIGITLALERPEWRVHATDLSPDALALARENSERLGDPAGIEFIECDLLPEEPTPFDLIVANLPYVSRSEMEALPREVRHDPAGALDGGEDGLDLIRRLLARVSHVLRPGGTILLEHGWNQRDGVRSLLDEAGLSEIRMIDDLQNLPRFASARRPGGPPSEGRGPRAGGRGPGGISSGRWSQAVSCLDFFLLPPFPRSGRSKQIAVEEPSRSPGLHNFPPACFASPAIC